MTKLKELRERRIVQILVAYGAIAWIVVQGAGQLIDREILPEFLFAIILVWSLLGFVAAAIIGWFHGERGNQKAPPVEIAMLVVLGLVAVVHTGTHLYDQRPEPREEAASRLALNRIVVRDLEDRSPDLSLGPLADGLTDALIRDLDRVRDLEVVGRDEAAAFRHPSVPADSVARGLRAGTVLEGFLQPAGEGVRVQAQLVDGTSGMVVDRVAFGHATDPLPALERELANRVARLLSAWLGEEVEVPRRAP